MSAVIIKFPAGFKASDLGPLRKALADMANKHGLEIEASNFGRTYELRKVYEPCKVVPLRKPDPAHNHQWPNPAA